MSTRKARKESFVRLFKDIMDTEADDPIHNVFSSNSITMIPEILVMSRENINGLTYQADDGTTITPPSHVLAKLHILKAWNNYLLQENGLKVIDWDDTNLVNEDAYDEFRLSIYNPDDVLNTTPPHRKSNISAAKNSEKKHSAAAEFRKGIKRDKSHYTILSDEKNWDEWKRLTIATIYAHGCENITSKSYSPQEPDEIVLFQEQNKYMFDVFTHVLKTPMGKYIVRNHEHTRDAQKVWADYIKYMRTSTKADIEIEDLMTSLTSTRLSTDYTGSTQNFIIEWLDRMRKFEELTPRNSHFPDTMKKAMLQNAISDFSVFRSVKLTEQVDVAKGNGPIPYLQYIGLLQSVASSYDRNVSATVRTKRITNYHEVNDDFSPIVSRGEETEILEQEYYGSYQINTASAKNRNRPSLRKETWLKLPRADQLVWDQMSDFAKWTIIMDNRKISEGKTAAPATPKKTPPYERNSSTALTDRVVAQNLVTPTSSINNTNAHSFTMATVPDDNSTVLINTINSANQHQSEGAEGVLTSADIRHVLSDPSTPVTTNIVPPEHSTMQRYIANVLQYRVSNKTIENTRSSLIDRGANGGIAGSNLRVLAKTDKTVDVAGIDDHEMNDLPVVSAGGVIMTQRGPIIGIFHQYAYLPSGKTIHSCIQLESYGIKVDDRSVKLKQGKQLVQTLEGYIIPLDFVHGLPYMHIRPFSDDEWEYLPHIIFTSDVDWDPDLADHKISGKKDWFDNQPNIDPDGDYDFRLFDQQGNYQISKVLSSRCRLQNERYSINERSVTPVQPKYKEYSPYFLFASEDAIKRTFKATTQYARSGWITGRITQTHKAPFPALNVLRRNEAVATDTIYCDVPALDNGSVCAQFYVGVDTKFCSAYGIKTDGQFIDTLLNTIRFHGAMHTLITDGAKAELSKRVQDVLRHMIIKHHQSEPHFQHQNPAERRYKTVKSNVNIVLNRTGAPSQYWLLCLQYVIFIMNRMALQSLNWRTPFEQLIGTSPDISAIYRFCFYEKVYFERDESRGGKAFPSQSNEEIGRFAGFSNSVGHALTYIVVTKANKIIHRSRLRAATTGLNLRIDHDSSGTPADQRNEPTEIPSIITDRDEREGTNHPMQIIDPNAIIGRTYLTNPNDDGTRHRMRIIEQLRNIDSDNASDPDTIRFRASNTDDTIEDIVTYNNVINILEPDDGDDGEWKFRAIVGHDGPIKQYDPRYKGSKWNLHIEWQNGDLTWEPLNIIRHSDPVSCAIYARDNGLLDLPGWTRFKKLATKQDKMIRTINVSKHKAARYKPMYKFGVQVPRNHSEAMALDRLNNNTMWADAELKELNQIDDYNTFIDAGVNTIPDNHKKIKIHMVYDVKPDLRRKARLVADGHLTDVPVDSNYSSVVSLKGLKYVIFIAEHSGLELWSTDVGNAYLEAFTQEKIYIIAGPEFGPREGKTLIVSKALYGLKSSGLRWWERFSEILLDLGFSPSKAEDDIWMRDMNDHYEYLARYVDDLAIASRSPKGIISALETSHGLKLKGSGPMQYHLGADFWRDEHGVFCMSPSKYIDRMIENYVRMFGSKPKSSFTSPLEKGDHPELDTSPLIGEDGIKKYQSLIGALQWVVTLGRFDIAAAVMTMSSFRVAPRDGHLDRVKRIYGYLNKMRHAATRFRVKKPDLSSIPIPVYDWEKSIYGNVTEEIPNDIPKPYGQPIETICYVDANLQHDVITGRAVTGIIHLMNQSIVHYYTKKQGIVETATYGSEFMAARIATEQIMEMRLQLRYLGVRLANPTYLFGDNRTVVNSSVTPKARLHKRHVLLSFHRVREAIAAKVISFSFIPGTINPADILTKSWGYQQVKTTLKAMLFWKGNTLDIKS